MNLSLKTSYKQNPHILNDMTSS